MYQYLPLLITNDINKKLIQQLNKRLESIIEHIKFLEHNANIIKNDFAKTRADLNQRYELRNNYYHPKLPLLLHDLCIIESNRNYFQLVEKQHYRSIEFYKKIVNIQSSINMGQYDEQLQQSIKFLNDLKNSVSQYENDIDQLKQQIINQNQQIKFYMEHLFDIQYEQNKTQSDIRQLQQKILFEKRFSDIKQQYLNEKNFVYDVKNTLKTDEQNAQKFVQEEYEYFNKLGQEQQTLVKQEVTLKSDLENIKSSNQNQFNQFHTEYADLSKQITQIELNIKQKLDDLLPFQTELHAYRKIFSMNETYSNQSKTQISIVPTAAATPTAYARGAIRQSVSLIKKYNKNITSCAQQKQLPTNSIGKSECTKLKSKESKAVQDLCLTSSFFFKYPDGQCKNLSN